MARASFFPRVGFDARWYNDSGVGTYVAELLRAMGSQPREFELVVYENPENPVPSLDQLSVTRIPVRSSRYSLSEQWEFRERVREDRIDLLHSPFYAAPLAIGCPVVITIHDLIPFLFKIHSWAKQMIVRSGYRLAAWRADYVIADSQCTARDIGRFLKISAVHTRVVPLAAARCFQPKSRSGELERLRAHYEVRPPYVVVSSARNWRTKNLENALRALEIARRQSHADFQTVVCGPREGIDACLTRGTPELNLKVVGYVGSDDLAALLRNAHAFVTASLYEGFGLPVVEAMACGCAVVSSNAGSLAEVAEGGAQLFHPFDIERIGTAVAHLLNDPETLSRWRQAAILRARDFCWNKTAANTMAIYREILKERAVRFSSANQGEATA